MTVAAGCETTTDDGAAVDVHAVAAESVPPAVIAALRSISVETSGAATARVVVHGAASSSGWRVRLRAGASSGALTVTVTGRDRAGVGLVRGVADLVVEGGRGAVTVTLDELLPRPDLGGVDLAGPPPDLGAGDLASTDKDLLAPPDLIAPPESDLLAPADLDQPADLTAPSGSDLAAPSGFAIQPKTTSVLLGGNELFVGGPGGVDWSLEGDPATASIGPDGIFRATAAGTYTVVGTSALGLGTDRATVTVRAATIDRVAGPLGGFGYLDGVGTGARFFRPADLCDDGAGNVYLVDDGNAVIRKLVVATGQVTTLVGKVGRAGFSDGVGSAAQFYNPQGIACDGASTLYVADQSNHVIREIDVATRTVTTFAGQPGSSGAVAGIGAAARLSNPKRLAIANTGTTKYLYVAELSRRIRRIDLSTNNVELWAGTGASGATNGPVASATFNTPNALVWDGPWPGTLYLVDRGAQRIRAIDLATDTASTLAGSGGSGSTDALGTAASFRAPTGGTLVDDGSTHALYVAEEGNHTIRRIELTPGPSFAGVTTIAGTAQQSGITDGTGAAARFYVPTALVALGNLLYVADYGNGTVRSVARDTTAVATVAGLGRSSTATDGTGAAARFWGIRDVVVDGNIAWVGDENAIRKVDLTTGEVTTHAGSLTANAETDGVGASARFARIMGLGLDVDGTLYVADKTTIRKVVLSTAEVTTIAGNAADYIYQARDGVGAAARFYGPEAMRLAGKTLYVIDGASLRTVDLTSMQVTTIVGDASSYGFVDGVGTAARLWGASSLALDGAGNLYIGDGCTVRAVDLATRRVTTLAGYQALCDHREGIGRAARFGDVRCLDWDPATSTLVACEPEIGGLVRVRPSTGAVTVLLGREGLHGVELGPLPGNFNNALAVTVVGGSLFAGDYTEGALLHVH